ncbi:MAG: hypothetical protein ABSD63_01580 [Candidatus Korobacteraceae bacterium]
MSRIGKCLLCLNDTAELCRGHFFPAAAYRIIRDEAIRSGWSKNPNPVRMTDLSAVQTSSQYVTYLLCHCCEQRFSAKGEEWVLQHCWRGKSFHLSSLVARAKPSLTSPVASVYDAAGISGIDIPALTYFAASMYWRAAIHNWSGRSIEPAIDLGPYGEELRRYLTGIAEFPENCILLVVLPTHNSEFVKLMMHPYPTRTHGFRVYTMPFLGISFSLYVGRQTPHDWREADFVRGAGNPIIVASHFEDWFRHDLALLFGGENRALSMLDKIERQ